MARSRPEILRRSSGGFSLIELIVAVGIAAIVMAFISTIVLVSNSNFSVEKGRLETLAKAVRAEYYLRTFFTPGVYVEQTAGAITNGSTITLQSGKVRQSYNANTLSGPTLETIALFMREVSAQEYSFFRPTGVFYHRPTSNTSGVLFIDGGVTGQISPGYDDIFIDDLVEFSSEVIGDPIAPSYRVSAIRFRMVFRYFSGSPSGARIWCPQMDIDANQPNCNVVGQRPYTDIERNVVIKIANNSLDIKPRDARATKDSPFERVMGYLHLFRLTW